MNPEEIMAGLTKGYNYELPFRPSQKTAQFALEALAKDSTRLDITSSYRPPWKSAPINYEQVRNLIGDETLSMLCTVSEFCLEDEKVDVPVFTKEQRLGELLETDLGDLLGLDPYKNLDIILLTGDLATSGSAPHHIMG